ncbi:hypothetical protein CRG98_005050 [Punica granatum]|uniref:Uncharacterized protein n=1 Tax=Punica granatum TaxID=22663 RepID=A0A2I0L264_PUNGR|nr:hypothetical protein CRG98_005050 [Punica granatum]
MASTQTIHSEHELKPLRNEDLFYCARLLGSCCSSEHCMVRLHAECPSPAPMPARVHHHCRLSPAATVGRPDR